MTILERNNSEKDNPEQGRIWKRTNRTINSEKQFCKGKIWKMVILERTNLKKKNQKREIMKRDNYGKGNLKKDNSGNDKSEKGQF